MNREKGTKQKKRVGGFTEGPILSALIRFSLPVLLAMFLQAMYGAVDLMVVGRFATAADVSAVSTGSQIMFSLTGLVSSFAMGATVLLGRQIGEGQPQKGGQTVGACIVLFAAIGVVMTAIVVPGAGLIADVMQAPDKAYDLTVSYVRICGAGLMIIIAYNLIGCVFRGEGDSVTPLVTVAIACVCNIVGDVLLVGAAGKGAAGAAAATVLSQAVSVVISLAIIRKKDLPFQMRRAHVRFDRALVGEITRLGLPIALQDVLVSASFLIIQAIVNGIGLIASAGVGVAEKVCAFIMLVPSAFMQAMSAFVAHNAGAGRYDRAEKALRNGIAVSMCCGVVMAALSCFRGEWLAGMFTPDEEVVLAAAQYLKAYAIDCLLTPIFFCFIGYYNGLGMTRFVMLQGVVSAFGVRVPVSWIMSRQPDPSLFHIGLATPCSSALQIVLCLAYMRYIKKHIPERTAGNMARQNAKTGTEPKR